MGAEYEDEVDCGWYYTSNSSNHHTVCMSWFQMFLIQAVSVAMDHRFGLFLVHRRIGWFQTYKNVPGASSILS